MRRSLIVLTVGIVAALALAGAALSKEAGVELSSTPFGTPPGGTWTPNITVIDPTGKYPADATPVVKVTNLGTGEQRAYSARPAKVPSTTETTTFTVAVVFPTPGRYSYTVTDGFTDREYTFPPVRIVGSGSAVPVPSAGGDGSFPVWAPVVGGIALLIVAGGAAVYARRRRFGLSH